MYSLSKSRGFSEQGLLGLKHPPKKGLDIVRQSKQERAERQKKKQEQAAATKIQAWWRSTLTRLRVKREWRHTWDCTWLPRLSTITSSSLPTPSPLTALELFHATRLLLAFYSPQNTIKFHRTTANVVSTLRSTKSEEATLMSDSQRLDLLLQAIFTSTTLEPPFNYVSLSEKENIQQNLLHSLPVTSSPSSTTISSSDWIYQVTKLLSVALQRYSQTPQPPPEITTVTLRLTLLLSSRSSSQLTTQLLMNLMKRGLFESLHNILVCGAPIEEHWAACRTLVLRCMSALRLQQPTTLTPPSPPPPPPPQQQHQHQHQHQHHHQSLQMKQNSTTTSPLASNDPSSLVIRVGTSYLFSLLSLSWPEHHLTESDMLIATSTALHSCVCFSSSPSSLCLTLPASFSLACALTLLQNLTIQLRAILTFHSPLFTPLNASLWIQALSSLIEVVHPLPSLVSTDSASFIHNNNNNNNKDVDVDVLNDDNDSDLNSEVQLGTVLSMSSPTQSPPMSPSKEVLTVVNSVMSFLFQTPHYAVMPLCSLLWSTVPLPSSSVVPLNTIVPVGIAALARLCVHLLTPPLKLSLFVSSTLPPKERALYTLAVPFVQPLLPRLLHCFELLQQSYTSSWDMLGLTHLLIVSAHCLHAVLSELDDYTLYRNEDNPWSVDRVRPLGAILYRITLQLYDDSISSTFSSRALFLYLRDALTTLLRLLHDHSVRHAHLKGTLTVSGDAALLPPPTLHFRTDAEVQHYAHNLNWLRLLSACPFLLTTHDKVKLWHVWLCEERERVQQNSEPLHIQIRRSHLLQDAFQKLNPLRRDLRRTVRIEFINTEGLAEAGIDGGGLFRELIYEVIKTVFSPNYGLFTQTLSPEEWLYPNPSSSILLDDHLEKFAFLGRLIGKCLFEECLVDLPLAPFFLAHILERPIYVWQLAQLDPELYTHLVALRTSTEPIENLDLTFTILDDVTDVERHAKTSLTRNTNTVSNTNSMNNPTTLREVELIPGGQQILVTKDNLEDYIRAIARYRLYTQIVPQSHAFRQGILDLINAEWIRLLGWNEYEFGMLISGTNQGLDLVDFQQNVVYAGGYHPTHPVILNFWEVVKEFTPQQQSLLLRFATSSSRPPLLGFAHLNPKFCIKLSSLDDSFLPTANTCMNLLKLPAYSTKERLREKLLYAITSKSGFDLS